jgi:transposase
MLGEANCITSSLTEKAVIVMHNATFHKGGDIQKIITKAGHILFYLPPYILQI